MSHAYEQLPRLKNGQPVPLSQVPVLDFDEFRATVVAHATGAIRLAAFFAHPLDGESRFRLFAVLADASEGDLLPLAADITHDHYPSLTTDCPQAHNFEREIAEQWAIVPEGHPWLKPLRYHHSYRPGHDAWSRPDAAEILPCVTDYFHLDGQEVHEVAVGPVHAGVIEPGSFRFQCHGENVYHLEIHLGYQHRGVEPKLIGGPDKRTLHYMETLAGDTSIGHSTAYCQVVEGLAGATVSPRAHAIRSMALELERLACHTGDLGALADDVGYLPTANYCGRLRGDFLNATGMICGNRFGRSLVTPGGVRFDVNGEMSQALIKRLTAALRDVGGAAQLLWNSQTVRARFENTGILSRQKAELLGIVGVALRASGVERDVRQDFPSGFFKTASIPVATLDSGDVFARAYVRWMEIERSCQFVIDHLHTLPHGAVRGEVGPMAAESFVVSLVEGWRGAICHVALTDQSGRFARYKVVDPSFHNWTGLAMVLRNQQISDFPLCNKSFNLSYCGHDL